MTTLADYIYLLRSKSGRVKVEVYDGITYRYDRSLTVPNAKRVGDMTSCEHNRCLYISNHDDKCQCVHRVEVQGEVTQWAVNDEPTSLSVNAEYNVIVTCPKARKIKVFSSRGERLRELTLRDNVTNPSHAVQIRSGQFIVCHGSFRINDTNHRVCMMSADGDDLRIVYAHGGPRGSDNEQYNVPLRLAIDDDESVFVGDNHNCRVTLLSPTLEYIREVVPGDKLKWRLARIHLQQQKRLLYVAENEWSNNTWAELGRVAVFSV